MVLVSSFGAMQNSRPRMTAIEHSAIPYGVPEEQTQQRIQQSQQQDFNYDNPYYSRLQQHPHHQHNHQHQQQIGSDVTHNEYKSQSKQHYPASSRDRSEAWRRSTLEHFTPPPGGTPPSSSISSSTPPSSSTTSPTKTKTMMVNGFITHSRQPESPNRVRRFGQVKNGYIMDNHEQDYARLDESRPPIQTARSMDVPSIIPKQNSQDLPAHYSSSSLIDAGDHLSQRNSTTPSSQHHHHTFSKVDATEAAGNKSSHPRSRQNGFTRGHSFPVNGTTPRGPLPVTSMSMDSPYSSMTSLDTWSPNYVKLSFFMSSGDADPIHNPVPRGTNDRFQRSESAGSFRSLPGNEASSSSNSKPTAINKPMVKSSSSDYAMRLSSQSYCDLSNTGTRQSLQSTYSKSFRADDYSPSRSSAKYGGHFSGRSSTGTNVWDSSNAHSVYGTLPRRGSSDQHLRRTVSHEPKGQENKAILIKTPSDGEIESEYVTLDRRYVPLNNTRLCRVAEVVVHPPDNSPPSHNLSSSSSSNGSSRHIDHIHNNIVSTNSDATNSDNGSGQSNLVKSSKSMSLLKTTNTLPENRRPSLKKKTSTGTLRTVAETLGSVFSTSRSSGGSSRGSGSPRSIGSLRDTGHSFEHSTIITNSNTNSMRRNSSNGRPDHPQRMSRSKSLPDLQADEKATSNDEEKNYSDDEDGDDFGFLSYPISFSSSCTSTAMNKAKSPSPGNRIIPKRWRSKTKAVPSVASSAAMWTPGPPGSCTWSSVSGRKVQLRPVSILNLTEAERLALQKIALSRLQTMDIGCPVAIPKENAELRRTKKSSLSLKRRSKSVSASALDTMGKEGGATGLVFGIPLNKCIVNDKELEKKRRKMAAVTGSPASMKMRMDSSDNLLTSRSARKSSSSSQGSLDNSSSMVSQQHEPLAVPSHKRAASSDSLSESESSRNTSSSLIDALSLSTSNPASRLSSLTMDGSRLANQGEAQVPYVVRACFKHIETYGLQTLGIFRVGCSKKRVKQLREEFDSGKDVQLTEEYHPHDVGALLKEYFRDLPEPLLSRELYLPFLHAERMKDEHKKHVALGLLISMLPVANRDTLWALLRFLATVSQHAPDETDEKGETISGNKMDAHNLATLFGPNILHRTKAATDKELMAESAERVEQSKEVIEVVKDMIDNHHELFEISGSLRDDVLRLLIESDQETADRILRHLANQNQIEADPESMCSVFEDPSNSPMLYHAVNSDADLLSYSRKQTTTSHRPLRVTKSADNSLDSPVSKSRATHLSESQAFSPTSRDNQKVVPSNPGPPRFDLGHSYPSPVPARVPVLRVSHDSANPEVVLRGRLETANLERPYSEGYSHNLNIPRPLYLRENSSSSVSSSGLSSSLNSHGGSDNSQSGHWILPTPPASRGSSPKPYFRSASSSSTLIASPSPPRLNHSRSQDDDDDYENNPPVGSAEWERERWKHWEKIAAQKKTSEAEQETLV